MTMQNNQNTNIQLIQYRNGIYQGGFLRGRRQGKGILITDNSEIFITNWQNDYMNGQALIWLNEKTHVIGEFNKGYMDGDFIFRNQNSSFYASFNLNKLVGLLVYIDKKQDYGKLIQYKNQNYRVIKDINTIGMKQNQILQQLLGYKITLPTLAEYLKKQLFDDKSFICQNINIGSYYIGFNRGDTVQKIGFTIINEELLSMGCFIDMRLQGFGTKFESKIKLEGQFKNGLITGIGIKTQPNLEKYLIGNFLNGNVKQIEQIVQNQQKLKNRRAQIKKILHMQSVYFFNSFINSDGLLPYKEYEEVVYKIQTQSLKLESLTQKQKLENIKFMTETKRRPQIKIYAPKQFGSTKYKQNQIGISPTYQKKDINEIIAKYKPISQNNSAYKMKSPQFEKDSYKYKLDNSSSRLRNPQEGYEKVSYNSKKTNSLRQDIQQYQDIQNLIKQKKKYI